MSRRIGFLLLAVPLIAAACSRDPEQKSVAASPTAPTAVASTVAQASGGSAVSGAMALAGRADAYQFRRELETQYQTALSRSASSPTAVDTEGEAVWMAVWFNYRQTGCDQGTAIQRMTSMIDGNPAGATCGPEPEPLVAALPRDQAVEARRAIEVKYQQMGRSATANFNIADPEGAAIWESTYLYHRANSCDHATARDKTFAEIRGQGPQAVCYVPPACSFYFNTTNFVRVSGVAGSYSAEVLRYTGSGSCSWTAASDSSWLTITSGSTGGDRDVIRYSTTANLGLARSGKIRISWTGGSAVLDVSQQDRVFAIDVQMFDYKESTGATTECKIKSVGGAQTTCFFVATPRLNEGPKTILWSATYDYYGASRNPNTNSGASPNFSFQESCKAGASAGGDTTGVTLNIDVTDTAGNRQTATFNYTLRIFPCP